MASNTPISVAVGLGAERLIVLPTGFACSLEAPPRGPITSALHAITVLVANQLVMELERYCGQAEIITVPPLCPLAVSLYDFSRAAELIERIADHTRGWLDSGGLTRERVPGALRPHAHADGTEAGEEQHGAMKQPAGRTGDSLASDMSD